MKRILGLLLVLGLLVGLTVAPAASALHGDATHRASQQPASLQTEAMTQSDATGEITYFSMEGRGYIYGQEELVEDHPGVPFVWESETLETKVTLEPQPSTNTKKVCGRILDEQHEEVESIGCTSWNSSSRKRRASLELPAWPAGASGTHYLQYVYLEEVPTNGTNETNGTNDSQSGDEQQYEQVEHDRFQTEVYVINKQGDLDGDGLSNAREVEVGTDFTRQDTDGDGVSDRAEVYQYGSDPLKTDTTGDGIDDGTIASFGLPPTVPYIVHIVVFGGLVAVVGVAVGSLKLWRLLQESDREPPASMPPQTSGDSGSPGPPGPGQAATDGAPRSKEDEVFNVIHEHGGQMRQADLVDETEWSKATVSRLLSTLEDEGRVEKIRVGRGNVVRLTDAATEDSNLAGTAHESG